MIERTNKEWLTELRGPEQEIALADLHSRLIRGLRYALAKYGNVAEEDVEDFVQEALLKILDGLDSFRGESRFTTWAQKIAVHTALSELRKRRWKNTSLEDLTAPYEETGFTPPILADQDPGTEQQVTQRILMETVQRLITEELTDRQRQAMVAAIIGGMPLGEVARRMGTNRNALYKLLHDARQRLKERLIAEGLSPQDVLAVFET